MTPVKSRFNPLHAALIALFVFLIYSNCLGNGFVKDDHDQILNNTAIRSFLNLPSGFTSNIFSGLQSTALNNSNYYRPFMHLAYWAIYSVFGLRPWGFHLSSLILHAVNSVLVYWIALLLAENGIGALVAGLIFAAHPVHVEPVAWAAGLPDLLAAFFSFSAFFFFVKYADRSKYSRYFILESFFILSAFLSKEPALAVPVIVIAYDLFLSGSKKNPLISLKRYAPFGFACTVYFAMRFYALKNLAGINHPDIGPAEMFIAAARYFSGYLLNVFYPVHLNTYIFRPVSPVFDLKFFISVLAAVIFTLFLYGSFVLDKRYLFSGLFFLLPLLPCLYIPGVGFEFADRYLYIPLAGFALSAGLVASKLYGGKWKKLWIFALSGMLIFYSVLSFERNRVWADDAAAWADAVSRAPEDGYVRFQYADALNKKGKLDEAVGTYRKALALKFMSPDSAVIYSRLGDALLHKGDMKGAIEAFKQGLSVKGADINDILAIRNNLAGIYLAINKKQEAVEQYKEMLKERTDPDICKQLAGLGYPQVCR